MVPDFRAASAPGRRPLTALDFIPPLLSDFRAKGLYREPKTLTDLQGTRATVDGREVLLFCSNDYLGLSAHPDLKRAAAEAIHRYGCGAGASRLISGTMEVHRQLEERIARFLGAEAALTFPTGYMANAGAITALMEAGDAVICDRLNHASIFDGCRAARAKLLVYPHRDVDALERVLKRAQTFRRRLIVTDGVFSMDGDVAPLREIVALARRYGAMTMVDEAHATGVLGADGRGTLEHCGVKGEADVIMGSLSKALGTMGGFIAGGRPLIDLLIQRARSFIYTTALPPAVCAASIAALDLIEREPALRRRLWSNVERAGAGLRAMGLDLRDSETPILPIFIGDVERTMALSDRLFEAGILLIGIRPPTVPAGESRLRLSVTAAHTEGDIERLLAEIEQVSKS